LDEARSVRVGGVYPQPSVMPMLTCVFMYDYKNNQKCSQKPQPPWGTGHMTSSITWPFDSPYAISYRCSVVTESPSSVSRFRVIRPRHMLTKEHTNIPTNTTDRDTSWRK